MFGALNQVRANDSESAAVAFATTLFITERQADVLQWLLDAALQDGSAMNARALSEALRLGALAALRSPQLPSDPARRAPYEETLDLAAGMLMNALSILVVDGAKCADETATGDRIQSFVSGYAGFIREIGAFPPERRVRVKNFALALERSTEPNRALDPMICRGGLREVSRAIAESWAANLPLDSPEFDRRGRVDANGVRQIMLPATPERPDMYRPQSELPAAVARARGQLRQLLDQLIP